MGVVRACARCWSRPARMPRPFALARVRDLVPLPAPVHLSSRCPLHPPTSPSSCQRPTHYASPTSRSSRRQHVARARTRTLGCGPRADPGRHAPASAHTRARRAAVPALLAAAPCPRPLREHATCAHTTRARAPFRCARRLCGRDSCGRAANAAGPPRGRAPGFGPCYPGPAGDRRDMPLQNMSSLAL
jgi:hypothetical protein